MLIAIIFIAIIWQCQNLIVCHGHVPRLMMKLLWLSHHFPVLFMSICKSVGESCGSAWRNRISDLLGKQPMFLTAELCLQPPCDNSHFKTLFLPLFHMLCSNFVLQAPYLWSELNVTLERSLSPKPLPECFGFTPHFAVTSFGLDTSSLTGAVGGSYHTGSLRLCSNFYLLRGKVWVTFTFHMPTACIF